MEGLSYLGKRSLRFGRDDVVDGRDDMVDGREDMVDGRDDGSKDGRDGVSLINYHSLISFQRSNHSGFWDVIKSVFFSRLHFFNCFTRFMASYIDGNNSSWTHRFKLYFDEKEFKYC